MNNTQLIFPTISLTPVDDMYQNQREAIYTFKNKTIIVPEGYLYDGASIPRFFWRVIGSPFHPRFMCAALPHDRCYTTHEFDKAWVDELFFRLLVIHGVSKEKAGLMFRAVEAFGADHWEA